MLRIVLVFGLLVTLAGVAVSDRAKPPFVGGHYKSNWDEVTLQQKGDHVTGTYVCCGGGTIEGRIIEHRVIKFVWRQPGGSGRGVWTIGPDRLDGTWGAQDSESSGGRWDLAKDRPAVAIAN